MRTPPVALLMFASVCMGQQTKPKFEISVKPTMPQAEADAYLKDHINPMVGRVMNDAALPASFRVLLNALSGQTYRKEVLFEAAAAYYPGRKDETFHLDYRREEQKPVLYAFVPALRDVERGMANLGFSAGQIAVAVAAMFAHEEVHVRLEAGSRAKYPLVARVGTIDFELAKKIEAEAQGITILEVYRPVLLRGGKLPEQWVRYSAELKKVADNYADRRWIDSFASYVE